MKKSAVIAAAAVVALAVVAQAGASTHTRHESLRTRNAQLTRNNRQLQTRLRNMTIARNDAKTALATATGQIGSLQSQNAGLQTQLTQLTSARDAALAEVAKLRIQIASVPTPLSVAVQQVTHEVVWARSQGNELPQGELVAVSAMNYVVGHVSTGEYGYLEVTGGVLPGATPDSVLTAQAGICGHAALTFAAIVKRLGFPVRSAQFYYATSDGTPDSHIAVEVQYDGAWHFFDPTFGVFWTDATGNVMSITDARAGGGTEQKDTVSFTNLIENPWYAGDDTAFETDPDTVVQLDQQPFIA